VTAIAIVASPDFDLCHAQIDRSPICVRFISIIGSPDIYVPDTAELELAGLGLAGGFISRGSRQPAGQGAPIIRIRGLALFSRVTMWRLPAELHDLPYKQARAAARSLAVGSGQHQPE
jgi:hypothetical protein